MIAVSPSIRRPFASSLPLPPSAADVLSHLKLCPWRDVGARLSHMGAREATSCPVPWFSGAGWAYRGLPVPVVAILFFGPFSQMALGVSRAVERTYSSGTRSPRTFEVPTAAQRWPCRKRKTARQGFICFLQNVCVVGSLVAVSPLLTTSDLAFCRAPVYRFPDSAILVPPCGAISVLPIESPCTDVVTYVI